MSDGKMSDGKKVQAVKFLVTNFDGKVCIHGNAAFLDHLIGLVEYFRDGEGGELDTATYALLTKLELNKHYITPV